MDCQANPFCASLSPEARESICSKCHIVSLKAGSRQIFERFIANDSILLSGLMTYSIEADIDVLDITQDIPVFFISTPGKLVSLDRFFHMRSEGYSLASVFCVTDCMLAIIDRDAVTQSASQHLEVSQAINNSFMTIIGDLCIQSSIFRSSSMVNATLRLMRFLMSGGVYATQAQMSYLLNCDRTTVSRALVSIKKSHPNIFSQYMTMKESTL